MAKKSGANKQSAKQKRLAAQQQQQRLQRLRVIGFVAIGVFIVGAIFAWRNLGRTPVAELAAATPPNIFGNPEAPVTVVEYGDFGCHSCRAWHNAGVKDQLLAEFGEQVNFEFRHFPVITPNSPKAAEASQCAAEQDAFWPYHDYIYEATREGALGTADLKQYAASVGLDQTTFDSCLDSGKYFDFIRTHWEDAVDLGSRGTPSFYIDGEPVFFSYDGLAEAISAELGS